MTLNDVIKSLVDQRELMGPGSGELEVMFTEFTGDEYKRIDCSEVWIDPDRIDGKLWMCLE